MNNQALYCDEQFLPTATGGLGSGMLGFRTSFGGIGGGLAGVHFHGATASLSTGSLPFPQSTLSAIQSHSQSKMHESSTQPLQYKAASARPSLRSLSVAQGTAPHGPQLCHSEPASSSSTLFSRPPSASDTTNTQQPGFLAAAAATATHFISAATTTRTRHPTPARPVPRLSPELAAAHHWVLSMCMDPEDLCSLQSGLGLTGFLPGSLGCHEVGRLYQYTPESTALGSYYYAVVQRKWRDELACMEPTTALQVDTALSHLAVNLAAKVLGDRYYSVQGLMQRAYGARLEDGFALRLELSFLDALDWRTAPCAFMARDEVEALESEVALASPVSP